MKRALRRAIARLAPRASAGGVRVLLYHAIDVPEPADPLALRVSRQQFLEQMTLLRDERYAVVPLAAVLDAAPTHDQRRVAITFDDGYRSQAWAATVLRQFGFPATFFLVPRFLDGVYATSRYWEQWGHLDWHKAAALGEDGFDVGAHSMTHPDLRTCAGAELDGEISGARTVLERRLGRAVVTFSYPHGRYDRRVRDAVRRAGYRLACTSRFGVNRTSGTPYDIRRIEITGDDDLGTFRAKLRGNYDWLGYWQDLKPTP